MQPMSWISADSLQQVARTILIMVKHIASTQPLLQSMTLSARSLPMQAVMWL